MNNIQIKFNVINKAADVLQLFQEFASSTPFTLDDIKLQASRWVILSEFVLTLRHLKTLSAKYKYPLKSLKKLHRENGYCSLIRLEMIIKGAA